MITFRRLDRRREEESLIKLMIQLLSYSKDFFFLISIVLQVYVRIYFVDKIILPCFSNMGELNFIKSYNIYLLPLIERGKKSKNVKN